MFILEKPYVSEFLKQTLIEKGYTVLDNETARRAFEDKPAGMVPAEEFLAQYKRAPECPVYSNSENAIDWMDGHLDIGGLPDKIRLFKDKGAFRDLLKDLYPDFYYRMAALEGLDSVAPAELPFPCVVKPSVGFFSLGVHMVESAADWPGALDAIHSEVSRIRTMYPAKVLELDNFIIEQCIEGEEFAVDAYFDKQGNPVIINILGHLFASSDDVGDRCYITSPKIISEHHDEFIALLAEIGKRADLRNFPIHIELRRDNSGHIGIIEVNPMRFAGWCVTDLAYYAYGINPYEYFMESKIPDWGKISNCCKGKVYAMIIGDIDSSVDCSKIKSVNYEAFLSNFTKPLELRKIDYREYPVFAFTFAEVEEENMEELKKMLHADFTQYLEFE
ncbi:ATP-grasp domain-containing protein [Maridesulfovibrio sp.]|uniref:ATP-grasp domain-containing protein n=1 Tax=Maridesulfovibrio sp. TaxID=2795000 RepID=UPI002A18E2F1|nr:ATP-grasp domain-containing protein [Maridesulfovibrio sp.]